MGVASIPDHKDQRDRDEWNALSPIRKMDVGKGVTEDFVTVVSVGNQSPAENFVTVLSIGSGKKEDEPPPASPATLPAKGQPNGVDGHLEEEVEVFRLPGERLGFGLKFEGGNKTSERVRRLFVQSCAEQSPASRAKCSWGTLGEGDEVLSIDGVPVTHMTRLDCVRRLKESQLVIRLMVRCRGALRPEVVSAERKTSPEKSKVPPELPSAPPPVPPRKLRQTRGSADGEANPSPVKKSWPSSQASSQASSLTSSPGSQAGNPCSKSTSYESCESSPKSVSSSVQESPKGSPKERSPDPTKSKQEPPEAMVYLDARSQCGSTHGSTSDDTGSSMSTVVDRFSTSDRVSTVSTASTASTASEQPGEFSRADQEYDRSSDRDLQLPRAICPFEHLEKEFSASPPDYLLRRLASSEAVTHVESRGEVERITAVVAPNTVLIEETITFQPPLSFQDAPLSYGHEPRPDLFYAADLAADSTTHFRPIKDDAEIVERVNGDHEEFRGAESTAVPEKTRETSGNDKTPPPLPARNHVNRIAVNQPANDAQNEPRPLNLSDLSDLPVLPVPEAPDNRPDAPVLPPKPLPRKDVKVRRKRPPPPPPPPLVKPRKDVGSSQSVETRQTNVERETGEPTSAETVETSCKQPDTSSVVTLKPAAVKTPVEPESCRRADSEKEDSNIGKTSEGHENEIFDSFDYRDGGGYKTNKVLEIIEIRKARALTPQKGTTVSYLEGNEIQDGPRIANENLRNCEAEKEITRVEVIVNNESNRSETVKSSIPVSGEFEDSDEVTPTRRTNCSKQLEQKLDGPTIRQLDVTALKDDQSGCCESSVQQGSEDDETYRSLDEINDDLNGSTVNRAIDDEEMLEEDDTTDESDDGDYYWQSNLATIGEEEETNSLEYTSVNKETNDAEIKPVEICQQSIAGKEDAYGANGRNDEVGPTCRTGELSAAEDGKTDAETVNGRMENCGGGQRLPPDGDEFPAAYQEFSGNDNSNGNNQQYRFVAATRTSTMTTNGGPACNETEAYAGAERNFKLLESSVVAAKSVVLPDSRVSQEGSKKMTVSNVEINGKMTISNAENLCQHGKPSYASDDFARKNPSANNYSGYGAQPANNVVISEKKIEITGYYHKDVSVIEEVQDRDKEVAADVPPPLPLTGPPKMETIHARNVLAVEQPQRKFSLNGELWRQDDKSERSVRDKIAMFSSQSSLDTPLFPNTVTVTAVTSNGRRLSKYKSSEDVCNDEKSPGQRERSSFFADRTQSSFDLTDSARNFNQDSGRKYGRRSPSLPQPVTLLPTLPTIHTSKTLPVVPQKPCVSLAASLTSAADTKSSVPSSPTKAYGPTSVSQPASPQNVPKNPSSPNASLKPVGPTALTRATSFSGSMPYVQQDRGSTASEHHSAGSQISRTNSLASTFRRPTEEIRRSSLNQLIEQRRRSISKLRGLVIPEKEAVPIDQPIVDLPEIKSRDSILLHQIPKANIQDKWGSQSSLASNTSTASAPLKATTSFKMPAPQIHSKYSPAFKRKSLAVYGSSTTGTSVNGSNAKVSSLTATCTTTLSEPPKSLESICSPTRSDYSFEFVSTSSSPEGSRNRPRAAQRKARIDYDDSDNDSAVSSSQSSISRGFSPPMSPVPSERSTVSSERSYVSTETNYQRRSLIMDSPTRTYVRESSSAEYSSRPSILGERTYLTERSSSSSSSSSLRSPQPTDVGSRNSQIPQRQLRRSNSTDTNCSTSSTLTSGSQASAESLSRRVLKPQSVEAINRKNILASARCRSGRDLNGSPLIQRKFSDDEDQPTTNENGTVQQRASHGKSASTGAQDIKIAYIEVTDPFMEDDSYENSAEEPKLPPKRSVPAPAARPPKSEMLEPSNDLKMWVRAEAKALVRSAEDRLTDKTETAGNAVQEPEVPAKISAPRNSRVSAFEENEAVQENRCANDETGSSLLESPRQRTRPQIPPKKPHEDQNDLLTILTTKSRSRSAIHVDDGTFGRSKSQMSLEDILGAKTDVKLSRGQSIEGKTEKNGDHSNAQSRASWDTKDSPSRYARRGTTAASETWTEDRGFVSKIPTLGRSRFVENGEEAAENDRARSTLSKIPTARNLGRRSASVTDMKKALEKVDVGTASPGQPQNSVSGHNRFPSLDSSVDESPVCTIGGDGEAERCYGEQFGSISSLASSTSLISQQELAQLVEEASLEEARGAHDVVVVLLHKENPTGSVGITLAGGADCEVKEITVHRVLAHSIADKDGRVQRGDRILSINGRSTRGLTHRESLAVLKQPRSEVVLVVSRSRIDEGCKLRSRTASVETIIEGFDTNGLAEDTAWGPPSVVAVYKDGAGLGFSLEGGRDSPLGDRPLVIKKIFTGGAAEKTGALKAGDQLLEVNGNDVTRMSRIEAWSLMKKLHDGEVNLLVRHPATKSS